MTYSTVNSLTLFDRDGDPIEIISPSESRFVGMSFSPDGEKLAFSFGGGIFVADMQEHVINDLCFETIPLRYEIGLAWSPDSTYLAFTYDSYPILLNVETLEMQILRYQTGEIIGWYPLDD